MYKGKEKFYTIFIAPKIMQILLVFFQHSPLFAFKLLLLKNIFSRKNEKLAIGIIMQFNLMKKKNSVNELYMSQRMLQ